MKAKNNFKEVIVQKSIQKGRKLSDPKNGDVLKA